MKKTIVAVMAVGLVLTSSCKNARTAKNAAAQNAEMSVEAVEAAKTMIADDVLSLLDELSATFIDAQGNFDIVATLRSTLTEKEKMVKPKFLINPIIAGDMITRKQQVSALSMLLVDRLVREVYSMPIEETDAAIVKLAVDLNYNFVPRQTVSEQIASDYASFRERGESAFFWLMAFTTQNEWLYILSQNPDIYLRDVTQEQYSSFQKRIKSVYEAALAIAPYDKELGEAVRICKCESLLQMKADMELKSPEGTVTVAMAKEALKTNQPIFAATRQFLLTD